ncbi:AAA family ATPase [Achromobacter denitrificans]|uniref:DNA/RNA helicase domain-containing protein n=1 Tax=Achromobacter denitrificans TaxID=32002 RepID=UPI000B4CDE44|nr:DNA/RNA helicase domain-containing protein [Achromobacter denitrificans]ASC67298.1 AAA family ATPase [Achromobacter denitrificans]
MIIYQASKTEFLHHTLRDDIEDIVLRHVRHAGVAGGGESEVRSWRSSLFEMAKVLQDEEIPDDAGIAIEYQLPSSSQRIDFMITGEDETGSPKVVIIELKQWSSSRYSSKDGIVWARRGGRNAEIEGPHPSYQAWSYAARLEDLNAAVHEQGIRLQPCAYLHNHPRDGQIDHPHYELHIQRAPLFLKSDKEKLSRFISKHVRRGDRLKSLYAIEHGRIQPSKSLVDYVASLMQGKSEFVLIDQQKVVYESILQIEARSEEKKQVVIVQGGPGTGKSVLAINLLAALIGRQRNARYVTKNRAPREVFQAKLTGTFTKTRIGNLFSGSGAFTKDESDTYDILLVDEAHRLNEKSGLYRNEGENQVLEIIRSARCTVFFTDDDQRVTIFDIGHTEELRRHARRLGAEITELALTSQFRCNGSEGYLAWLENTLGIRPTANQILDSSEYDFQVFDNPAEMHDLIARKNQANNRSRVVAGYCWPWPSKNNPEAWDIRLPQFDYQKRWNLSTDGSLWIVKPGSVQEVGCIHTCQGLELDYVGVIIGNDLTFRNGQIVTAPTQRASSDQSVRGLKKMMREDPERARELGDLIIKNTYRTLMTRGMKGCYVYCTDKALADYLRSRLITPLEPTSVVSLEDSNVVPLRQITEPKRQNSMTALPLIDIKMAAGAFSDIQALEEAANQWLEPPDWVTPQPGLFVAQVVGESMSRRIPNGSWCLFRANPAGTRQGKVVIVQHRSIDDPETGGKYTIKVYSSEKTINPDGSWQHEQIVLHPDSLQPGYEPIVIHREAAGDDFMIVAELLTVLDNEA